MEKAKKIAVVRVRGQVNLSQSLKSTFQMLNLFNKNGCVVVDDTPSFRGMIKRVKDYVTWGEITDDVFKKMVESKAEPYLGRLEDSKSMYKYNKYFTIGTKKFNKFIRLNPPKKGYGKEGIKMPFTKNGALGYRGEKINDLIEKMM